MSSWSSPSRAYMGTYSLLGTHRLPMLSVTISNWWLCIWLCPHGPWDHPALKSEPSWNHLTQVRLMLIITTAEWSWSWIGQHYIERYFVIFRRPNLHERDRILETPFNTLHSGSTPPPTVTSGIDEYNELFLALSILNWWFLLCSVTAVSDDDLSPLDWMSSRGQALWIWSLLRSVQ